MTGSRQVSSGVRQRLSAPRGHRFSRPGANRQSAVPRESHRPQQQRTTLIELWEPHSHQRATTPESDQARQERLLRQMEGNPRLAYKLQHHAVPHWTEVTHRRQEQGRREAHQAKQVRDAVEPSPKPPTATITRGRHRAPRRWWAWPAVVISTALLFAQSQAAPLGEVVFQSKFPL